MSEKEQTSERNENKTGEKAAASLGVGELLKQAREKKGLSHEQVSEMTRLRVHILKALEGEVWEELPPPVFVRGFIRSYARILDLDEKVALEGYEDHAAVADTMPQPLTVYGGHRRGRIIFLPIILCGIGLLLYLWIGFPLTETGQSPPEKKTVPELQEREKSPPE